MNRLTFQKLGMNVCYLSFLLNKMGHVAVELENPQRMFSALDPAIIVVRNDSHTGSSEVIAVKISPKEHPEWYSVRPSKAFLLPNDSVKISSFILPPEGAVEALISASACEQAAHSTHSTSTNSVLSDKDTFVVAGTLIVEIRQLLHHTYKATNQTSDLPPMQLFDAVWDELERNARVTRELHLPKVCRLSTKEYLQHIVMEQDERTKSVERELQYLRDAIAVRRSKYQHISADKKAKTNVVTEADVSCAQIGTQDRTADVSESFAPQPVKTVLLSVCVRRLLLLMVGGAAAELGSGYFFTSFLTDALFRIASYLFRV